MYNLTTESTERAQRTHSNTAKILPELILINMIFLMFYISKLNKPSKRYTTPKIYQYYIIPGFHYSIYRAYQDSSITVAEHSGILVFRHYSFPVFYLSSIPGFQHYSSRAFRHYRIPPLQLSSIPSFKHSRITVSEHSGITAFRYAIFRSFQLSNNIIFLSNLYYKHYYYINRKN